MVATYTAMNLYWDQGIRAGFISNQVLDPAKIEQNLRDERGKRCLLKCLETLWPSERRAVFSSPTAVDGLIRAGHDERLNQLKTELDQFDNAQKAIHTMLDDRGELLPNATKEIAALWNGVADGSYRSKKSPIEETERSDASRWADPNLIATMIKFGDPEACLTVIKRMEPSRQLIMLAAPPLLEYLFHGQPKATAELIAGLGSNSPPRPENTAVAVPPLTQRL